MATQITQLTDAELLSAVRQAVGETVAAESTWSDAVLYGKLTKANVDIFIEMVRADENWFLSATPQTLTTTAQPTNIQAFALPTGFYKQDSLWKCDGSSQRLPTPMPYLHRHHARQGIPGYYIQGTNTVLIYPGNVPAGDVYEMDYIAMPNKIDGTGTNVVAQVANEGIVWMRVVIECKTEKNDPLGSWPAWFQDEIRRFRGEIKNRAIHRKHRLNMGINNWLGR